MLDRPKTINDIPKELLLFSFSFLSNKELGNLACVSTWIKILAEDDSLWQHPAADLLASSGLRAKEVCQLLASGNHWDRLEKDDTTLDRLQKQLRDRLPLDAHQPFKVALITDVFNEKAEKIKSSLISYCEQHKGNIVFHSDKTFETYFRYIRLGFGQLDRFSLTRFGWFSVCGGGSDYWVMTNHKKLMRIWKELTAVIIVTDCRGSSNFFLNREISRLNEDNQLSSPFIFIIAEREVELSDHDEMDVEYYCCDSNSLTSKRDISPQDEDDQFVRFVEKQWSSIEDRLRVLLQRAATLVANEEKQTIDDEKSEAVSQQITSCRVA